MRILIHPDYQTLSRWVAYYVASKINRSHPTREKPFVLVLPTGSSPVGMYRELVKLNQEGSVSFEHVITFNMDEYVGIPEDHPQSYHYFMRRHFFDHVDITEANVHILDGNAPDLEQECETYEDKMKKIGGIDLLLSGIGSNGHIAFNEPGSSLTSRTRLKTLTYDTLVANAPFFDNDVEKVPKTALTVGVGTVMDADEILIIINGYKKARALQKVMEEGVNHMWTVSMLQLHQHAIIACDEEATMELKVGMVTYFKETEKHVLENLPEL